MSGFYAAENQIARSPIDGGIEITEQQYRDALEGVMAGKVVQIVEGSMVVDFPPEPDPEPAPDLTAPTNANVDRERDRRVAGTFAFDGVAFQLDTRSQQHITAMGADARFAIMAGAQESDLRWADPDHDFAWIATDNSLVPMDAQTMAAFSDAAKVWVSRHIHAARAIKDAIEAETPPADVTNDALWPD